MTPAGTLVGTLVIAFAIGSVAAAQQKNPYRNYTLDKFVENMQTAGRNYAAVTTLLGSADYESAKAQLTRAREQLAITITFWRDRQQAEAVGLLRTALNAMDGLDAALGAERVDASVVRTASDKVDSACNACHAIYRDQDPVTKAYRLKPGSVQ
jgi:hypothetical protein